MDLNQAVSSGVSLVKIKPIYKNGRTGYVLTEDVTIAGMQIPAGFISDGHSVPWFFRWIVSNHNLPLDAAFYHDYGYIVNPNNQSRSSVDSGYYKIMRSHKCPWYLAGCAWLGVRLGSWLWWRKYN